MEIDSHQRPEVDQADLDRVKNLFLAPKEARLVGNFLSGSDIPVTKRNRMNLWKKLKTSSKLETSTGTTVLRHISHLFVDNIEGSSDSDDEKETVPEYFESAVKRAKTILGISVASLQRFGLWPNQGRNVSTKAGPRNKKINSNICS